MTDRLTDEQVRELWERAIRARNCHVVRQCWAEAYTELGLLPLYTIGDDWERVKERAEQLKAERGVSGPNGLPDEVDLAEMIPLLAEVRRARGME